jgi:hypothetical protein
MMKKHSVVWAYGVGLALGAAALGACSKKNDAPAPEPAVLPGSEPAPAGSTGMAPARGLRPLNGPTGPLGSNRPVFRLPVRQITPPVNGQSPVPAASQ